MNRTRFLRGDAEVGVPLLRHLLIVSEERALGALWKIAHSLSKKMKKVN